MKIAFTGTHGTGKTTLARIISEDLKLPLIDNLAGRIWNMVTMGESNGGISSSGRDTLLRYQDSILRTYEFAEDYHYENSGGFITSRSVYDHYAYQQFIPSDEQIYIKGVGKADKDCYDLIHLHERMINYDFIFFTPIEFEFDFKRKGFSQNRVEVGKFLEDALYKDPILSKDITKKVCRLAGDVDQRLEKIIRVLSDIDLKPYKQD